MENWEIGDFSVTAVVLIVLSIAMIIFDFYLYLTKKETISERMLIFGKHSLAFVFLLGFIAGHFFW